MRKKGAFAILILILLVLTYFFGIYFDRSNDDDVLDEEGDDDTGFGKVYSSSTAARIHMDGEFSDWSELPFAYSDIIGDRPTGSIDLGVLKLANDENFLFLQFDLRREVLLQDNNSMILYIDTDNSTGTGIGVNGIGADLSWSFGERKGTYHGDRKITVRDEDIGFMAAPTVSSAVFEIAIDRNSVIDSEQLFTANGIRVLILDEPGGPEMIPHVNETLIYSFDDAPLPALDEISIDKAPGPDLRLVSYNVLRDNLFEPVLFEAYDRVLSALAPDIIGFVEIYDHNASETADVVERILPSGNGSKWYSMKRDPDIVVVSRLPINASYSIDSNGAFLLETGAGSQLLLIVAHLPSGDNNVERQEEIDGILAFVNDAKTGGGVLGIAVDTPIVIMGDMNLVGDARQLKTFISAGHDWDGSALTDLKPRHTDAPLYFTWYSGESSYWPGRLDFMFYTDSVLTVEKSFVLYTPGIRVESLTEHGLQEGDTSLISDHLPLVADLTLLTG